MKQRAIFFDRDGTLIHDVNYLSQLNDIQLIVPMLLWAAQKSQEGYLLFGVTNQSGVARGYFSELFVHQTHEYLAALFEKFNVFIEKWYICPHHEEGIVLEYTKKCECRKPKPGLLLQAAEEYSLDLSQSIMIGDKERDIEAGKAAGCATFFVHEMNYASIQ